MLDVEDDGMGSGIYLGIRERNEAAWESPTLNITPALVVDLRFAWLNSERERSGNSNVAHVFEMLMHRVHKLRYSERLSDAERGKEIAREWLYRKGQLGELGWCETTDQNANPAVGAVGSATNWLLSFGEWHARLFGRVFAGNKEAIESASDHDSAEQFSELVQSFRELPDLDFETAAARHREIVNGIRDWERRLFVIESHDVPNLPDIQKLDEARQFIVQASADQHTIEIWPKDWRGKLSELKRRLDNEYARKESVRSELEKRLRENPLGTYGEQVRLLKEDHPEWVGLPDAAKQLAEFNSAAISEVGLQSEAECPSEQSKPQPSCRVTLHGIDKKPVVKGNEKRKLRKTAYEIVEALVKVWPGSKSKGDLEGISTGYWQILDRLTKSDLDWADVIHFPGEAWKGYRIG